MSAATAASASTAVAVDVIIPTTARAERGAMLRRAVRSVRRATQRPVRIIAVVNGGHADAGLCVWLQRQQDVLVVHEARPSAPHALMIGRRHVSAPFFATLDDDDEFLDGALDRRLAVMAQRPTAAVVVTNGYRHAGADRTLLAHLGRVEDDPLGTLFEANWLTADNALYRSAAVTVADLDDYHPHAIWTWLAYKLCLAGRKVAVLDAPTCRIHDTPGSLSKSRTYADAHLPLYRRMLARKPPPAVRRIVLRRMGAEWHAQSDRALAEGRRLHALACHLRSLALPGGLRYLPYTRRLLPGWPKAIGAAAGAR